MDASANDNSAADCPSTEQLFAFRVGKLPQAPCDAVAEHIERCPRCIEVLAALDDSDDSIIKAAHGPVPSDLFATTPEKPELTESKANDSVGKSAGEAHHAKPEKDGQLPSIPGYQVQRRLGKGGMGIVYLARHLPFDRLVALKMIRSSEYMSEESRARFIDEARAAARFQHANIVQIHEIGEHKGLPYFSLEYVDGGSLAQKSAGTPQPPREAAALVETLARAVQHAHERGILHRDLKPANVLLGQDGGVKITDFGLAKRLDGEQGQTQTGAVLGTPSYMAPEQASGKTQSLTPATDVYALGAILYEILTGRPPHRGATTLDTLEQVRTQEPVPPSRLQPKVPRDLELICLKCLQKDSEKRYASARELAEDAQRFLQHKPIRARPVGNAERFLRWCRRKPAAAALAGALAALLVVIVVGSSVSALFLRRERDNVRKEEKEKTQNLWNAYLAEARALRLTHEAGRRFRALAALDKARELIPVAELTEQQVVDLRNETIACLCLADLGVAYEWEGHVPGSTKSAFDGASKRYARGDDEGNIIIYRVVDNQEVLRLPQHKAPVAFLRFSPNGKHLLAIYSIPVSNDVELLLWDCERRQAVFQVPKNQTLGISFSWDSRRLALGQRDGSIDIIDLTALENTVQRLPATIAPHQLAFHPDGQRIAVAGQGLVQVRNVQTGQALAKSPLPLSWSWPLPLAWTAQGNLLAVGCECKIFLFDESWLKQVAVLEGHQGTIVNLAFSYDGDLLASSAWDGSLRLWDLRASKQLVQTPSNLGNPDELQFSMDDRLLAWTSDGSKIRFWEANKSRECRSLNTNTQTGHNQFVQAFGLDGRILAAVHGGATHLWDWQIGKDIAALPGVVSGFCADGQSLLMGGTSGLHLLQIRPDPQKAGDCYQIGSSQCLWKKRVFMPPDERAVIAVADQSKRLILNTEKHNSPPVMVDHAQLTHATISPDNQWIATGTQHGTGVKIWQAANGQLVQDLPVGEGADALFTPDGRFLITRTYRECRFWAVSSWQSRHAIRAQADGFQGVTCSRKGPWLAAIHRVSLELIDRATLRQICSLEIPDRDTELINARLSTNGELLAASCTNGLIYVWDFRLIREELAAKGLDWNLPPFSPPEPADLQRDPIRLEVLLDGTSPELQPVQEWREQNKANLKKRIVEITAKLLTEPQTSALYLARGDCHLQLRDYRHALADYEKALTLRPSDATICNAVAWVYVAGPLDLRDAAKALPLVERAVRMSPYNWASRQKLGVAYYRLGRFDAAIESLQHSILDSNREPTARSLLFLAMSHHQLGNTAEAKDFYDRAVRWLRSQGDLSDLDREELNAFREEAEALLRQPSQAAGPDRDPVKGLEAVTPP